MSDVYRIWLVDIKSIFVIFIPLEAKYLKIVTISLTFVYHGQFANVYFLTSASNGIYPVIW